MPHFELPRFPRGFLLSERPVDPPPTFIAGPVLPHFWVHPWTHVEHAGDRDLFVIILGYCSPTRADQTIAPAEALLGALRQGETVFFQAASEYGGRHAIIFGSRGNIRVLNDATAMRTVFYAVGRGLVASHALLVEQALGGPIIRDELPFQYGYPGNRTPYSRTRALTANTYYWLTAKLVRRFWPTHRLAPVTVEQAAQSLLDRSVYALRHMAMGRKVRVTLTAGLDSRTILAIALHSGVPFETYTYGDDEGTDIDRAVATDLSRRFGVAHTVVGPRVHDSVLKKALREANYMDHHVPWVEPLHRYFSDRDTIAVLGNALEIGRSNTMSHRRYNNLRPITAEAMMHLHYRRIGTRIRGEIRQYGREQFLAKSRSAFEEFIEQTGYDLVSEWVNPFDLFYWEHRMSAWQAHAMNERDFYGESIIPFNSRAVFEAMLGVPAPQRYADEVVYRMIEMVDPGLLDWPVNPTDWPPKSVSDLSQGPSYDGSPVLA